MIDSLNELNSVFSHAMMKVLNLKEQLDLRLECSVDLALGDTPSSLNAKVFEHTAELRAGNFMLNDLMIQSQGLCEFSDIACLVKRKWLVKLIVTLDLFFIVVVCIYQKKSIDPKA